MTFLTNSRFFYFGNKIKQDTLRILFHKFSKKLQLLFGISFENCSDDSLMWIIFLKFNSFTITLIYYHILAEKKRIKCVNIIEYKIYLLATSFQFIFRQIQFIFRFFKIFGHPIKYLNIFISF